jgi:hypothetical protein
MYFDGEERHDQDPGRVDAMGTLHETTTLGLPSARSRRRPLLSRLGERYVSASWNPTDDVCKLVGFNANFVFQPGRRTTEREPERKKGLIVIPLGMAMDGS